MGAKKRACGTCAACCIGPPIHDRELQKEAYVPCTHLAEKGCGIYRDRPRACRVWDCAWLRGWVPAEFRPDRVGIIVSVERHSETPELGGEPVWVLFEAWEGAFESEKARAFLSDIESQAIVCYVKRDGTKPFYDKRRRLPIVNPNG